jgi:hypothetical protein
MRPSHCFLSRHSSKEFHSHMNNAANAAKNTNNNLPMYPFPGKSHMVHINFLRKTATFLLAETTQISVIMNDKYQHKPG